MARGGALAMVIVVRGEKPIKRSSLNRSPFLASVLALRPLSARCHRPQQRHLLAHPRAHPSISDNPLPFLWAKPVLAMLPLYTQNLLAPLAPRPRSTRSRAHNVNRRADCGASDATAR